ncbi:uncharacterized protein LOC125821622 [Solanum verrucosum]|uniref:uncharacterized protein LOC125821622 n=1 Tax=Solanum verrucosum TaxID=315347 RepID=UPI0020D0A9D9|nr:uncharacterized protein LOC125821622 [Solanum verrucosum]
MDHNQVTPFRIPRRTGSAWPSPPGVVKLLLTLSVGTKNEQILEQFSRDEDETILVDDLEDAQPKAQPACQDICQVHEKLGYQEKSYFVILDCKVDFEVPIILGRPFLATGRALVYVERGELRFRLNKDEVKFNSCRSMKQPNDMNMVSAMEVVDDEDMRVPIKERMAVETLATVLMNFDAGFHSDYIESINVLQGMGAHSYALKKLDLDLKNRTSPPAKPSIEEPSVQEVIKVLRRYKRAIGWTINDIIGIPPGIRTHKIQLEEVCSLNIEHQRRLNPHMQKVVKKEIIKWLDAGVVYPISGSHWISIAPEDQEKTTFTFPYGTFAFTRMTFGLCYVPATFQRCIKSIFSDMVKDTLEVFMDDFSVVGDTFDDCLLNLSRALQRCEKANLVLNWEKCHFMGVHSFLGYARFYKHFIKDFFKIAHPMCKLLEKEVKFVFDEACLKAFKFLKEKLISAPVIIGPNWAKPFEVMCDSNGAALGVVLGQKRNNMFHPIYYASKSLKGAQ